MYFINKINTINTTKLTVFIYAIIGQGGPRMVTIDFVAIVWHKNKVQPFCTDNRQSADVSLFSHIILYLLCIWGNLQKK